jgi:biotin carboxylase
LATDTITHVVVGLGQSLLTELDVLLPPHSVLVLEEPHVAAARNAEAKLAGHRCVARLGYAPVQDEHQLDGLLASVARPGHVVAVVPAHEYGVVAAAALAEAWGLPGAGLGAALTLRDKGRLRQAAGAAGSIAQPDWRVAPDVQAVAEFRAAHGGRCVLKPANRQASVGVQLLGPDTDLAAAWAETVGAGEPAALGRRLPPARVLVEELIESPEVSVEALIDRGEVLRLNVTAKLLLPGRNPVELGHTVPAAVSEVAASRLTAAMRDLVAATGFRSGILHAEWFLVDGAFPYLVECAGRIAGDGISTLIDLVYGGSLIGGLLEIMSGHGDRVDRDRQPRRGASMRFLVAEPGTVLAITGVAEAKSMPGVVHVDIATAVGARVNRVTSSWERLGGVMAMGKDEIQSAQRAEAAAAAIVIRTAAPQQAAEDLGYTLEPS